MYVPSTAWYRTAQETRRMRQPPEYTFRRASAKENSGQMTNRFIEYLKYGAGRPPGTMWAMEKSYFEWRHKYPGRDHQVYVRAALQSRYPLNNEIPAIAGRCQNLDDAILEAVRLDFGEFVTQMFKPALEAFPLCSACGEFRALSTGDALCYGCRNFGDLIPCRNCHLWWKKDSNFCQRCGAPLRAAPTRINRESLLPRSEQSVSGHESGQHFPPSGLEAAGHTQQDSQSSVPRFDYTDEELFRFGITYIVLGRWEGLVDSEDQARGSVMAVVQQVQEAGCKRQELIRQVYLPLQILLMARRRGDFCSIQREPAFSKASQRNFASLYDAFILGGKAAFDGEWKRIFNSPENSTGSGGSVITYSGGPGLWKESAVLLKGGDWETTVYAEYWYIAYSYGRMGVDWKLRIQALIKEEQEGKRYDLLEIELPEERHLRLYFDISHLPFWLNESLRLEILN